MKKGILTFHNCANYGAAFQAYALWKTLGALTTDEVELIDYNNPKISTSAQIERMEKEPTLARRLKNLVAIPYLKNKYKHIQTFLHTQAGLSPVIYKPENLILCQDEYDTIVFGSDQIWNMELTGNDLFYFGGFTHKIHKIAYAVSTGKCDIQKYMSQIYPLLQQFDAISTREAIDQKVLQEIFGIQAEHVLDPTLLLKASDWLSLEKPIKAPRAYVLLYLISPQNGDFEFAKRVGKKLGLPVLYIGYDWKCYPGVVNLRDVSPEQFLYLLHHAKLMVTNSFHGTVLSINLQKDFYWQKHTRAGRANARVSEILEQLELRDRTVVNNCAQSPCEIMDWSTAVQRLEQARKSSIEFLNRFLEGTNS